MNGLKEQEKQQALVYVKNGADLMFVPSSELCIMLVNNSPQTQGINKVMTALLLERKPVRLDPNIIIKYCCGTLDRNNTWLFDNGNIKVVPRQFKKEVKLKSEEEKEFFKKKPKIEGKDGKLIIGKKEENNNEK